MSVSVAFINPFLVSARDVFTKMVHVPVEVGKPYLKERTEPANVISATIGLTGAVTGSVVFGFSQAVALALASGMLGSPIAGLNTDCIDALGEIANMIAGGAKKDLPGGMSQLSLPTVILGHHRVEYPRGVPIIVVPCETPKGRFVIEVAIRQTAEAAKPAEVRAAPATKVVAAPTPAATASVEVTPAAAGDAPKTPAVAAA